MANRYIRHGATFCGDGTSKELATVNGGVGAWNDIAVFESTIAPAYGTLPAGTDVYIRTKDEAGNDITVTYAVAKVLGSTAATVANPITWVIDDGTVWPEANGLITYLTTTHVATTLVASNYLYASPAYNLLFTTSYTSWFTAQALVFSASTKTKNLKYDGSIVTGANGPNHFFTGGVHENFWVISHSRYTQVITVQFPTTVTLINPKIELTNPSEIDRVIIVGGGLVIYGGSISGAGATDSVPVVNLSTNSAYFASFGFVFPKNMKFGGQSMPNTTFIMANGSDGALGNDYGDSTCYYSSRADNYPPVLNATLETSSGSAWSYKLITHNTSDAAPGRVPISKLYTQPSAVKTVTLDLLWPTTMEAPTKNSVWIAVQYIDADTGVCVSQTSHVRNGSELDISSALWSATTWGPIIFTPYKLMVTTQSAVKQDTAVIVTLFVSPKAASLVNDVIFVCPDPVFT